MSRFPKLMAKLALGAVCIAAPLMPVLAEQPKREWTARDSVELRYETMRYDYPNLWPAMALGGHPALVSPDKRYFIIASNRADLDTDEQIIDVKLYESEAVRRALAQERKPSILEPMRRFSFSSTNKVYAMTDVRWEENSKGILFDGADSDGYPHAYRIDVATGDVQDLTTYNQDSSVRDQFAYRNGSSAHYVSARNPDKWFTYPGGWIGRKGNNDPIVTAQEAKILTMLVPVSGWGRCDGGSPVRLEKANVGMVDVAPTGCLAVISDKPDDNMYYRLVDLRTGSAKTLAQSGSFLSSTAWSPDGRHLALMAVIEGEDRSKPNMAIYDVAADKLQVLAKRGTIGRQYVRWLAPDRVLMGKTVDQAVVYSLQDGAWIEEPASADLFERDIEAELEFDVVVEQGQNTPATVLAERGTDKVVLTRPDPLLDTLKRGRWEKFTWEEDGETHEGALMMPTVRKGDGSPPLIIDGYSYLKYKDLFQPDGPHAGADSAAQVLAANGFAVAWLDAFKPESQDFLDQRTDWPLEGRVWVNRVDRVIDSLADSGKIDADKVGMIGFSRGGYLSLYHATHPGRRPVKAYAALDHGFDTFAYDVYSKISGRLQYVHYKGSFVENRALWDELDTLRNVDKVRAPMLFSSHGDGEFPGAEAIQTQTGGFFFARRPYDHIYFPDGQHQLVRPRQRFMLLTALADWMGFWLQGTEPSDPSRAKVWGRLKADWERQQAWEAAGNPVASEPAADFAADRPEKGG